MLCAESIPSVFSPPASHQPSQLSWNSIWELKFKKTMRTKHQSLAWKFTTCLVLYFLFTLVIGGKMTHQIIIKISQAATSTQSGSGLVQIDWRLNMSSKALNNQLQTLFCTFYLISFLLKLFKCSHNSNNNTLCLYIFSAIFNAFWFYYFICYVYLVSKLS